MKATVNIGKLDEVKIHDEEATISETRGTSKSGLIWKIVAVISTILLVLSVSIFSAYIMIQNNNKQEKQYQVTIHNDNGVTDSEKLVVTDIEEEFETKEAYLIFDFSTGLKVMSFKNNPDFQECYVNSFNMSEVPTPKQVMNTYTHTKIDLTAGDQILNEKYQVTDIQLNSVALGPRSEDLCQGKTVYMLKQLPVDQRVRRNKDKPKKEVTTEVRLLWGLISVKVTKKTK